MIISLEMENFCNFNISELKDLQNIKGKDIHIAGMVSNIEHRFTKGGKPFGTLTLEDYHDNITFSCLEATTLIISHTCPKVGFCMRNVVFKKKWGDGELEMKLTGLELLSEIKDKVIRSVNVSIAIQDLDMQVIESVMLLSKQFPGKHNLKFEVNDYDEGYQVPLRSRKFKINLNEDFILKLKQIPFLEIRIN